MNHKERYAQLIRILDEDEKAIEKYRDAKKNYKQLDFVTFINDYVKSHGLKKNT